MDDKDDKDGVASNERPWRESKSLLLITVAVALFLDNILVSAVVPILPHYLKEIKHANQTKTFPPTWHNKSEENMKLLSNDTLQLSKSADISTNMSVTIINLNDSFTTHNENETLAEEGTKFGFLLGSKPLVQLIVNPFVGSLAFRFGYRRVMFSGFILLFLSTLLFAYGETYEILFFARSVQGLASSCTSVTGMATLAKRFTVDKKRENSMRTALGGIALGLSLGPPFGGASYQFFSKQSPFLILCGLTLINGCMLMIISEPKSSKKKGEVKQTSFFKLIKDPYIIIAASGVFLLCAVYAIAEATLPLWMSDTMHSSRLQLGLAFIPNPICFVLVMNVIGKLCLRFERWLLITIGAVFSGVCLALFPFCRDIYHIVVPSCIMGIGAAMMELPLLPVFAHLVDIRHTPEYGNVYAISDVAVCLGLSIAPAWAGFVYQKVGFNAIMFGSAAICFLYAPLGYFLKNPPIRNEKKNASDAPTTVELLEHENSNRSGC